MGKIKTAFHWFLAACIAFCTANLFCFLYERPAGWFETPNGPSTAGWRPGSVIVHGMEGYGVVKVDANGYLNPEGDLAEDFVLMMGSSHTQGKEVPANQKYSVLVNDYFTKDCDMLYTYNISSDGHFLPSLIKHFPAAVEAFPEAGMMILEIATTDFSEDELESAGKQVQFDPQNTIVNQAEQLSTVARLKNAIKEYFPLLSLMKKKMRTNSATESSLPPMERNMEHYELLLDRTMEQLRGQFDGTILFVYHPNLVFGEKGKAVIDYSETWNLFYNACQAHGIDVIDMGPVFMDHYGHTRQLPYGFSNTTPGSGHLNKVGHRLIAQRVIAYLEDVA